MTPIKTALAALAAVSALAGTAQADQFLVQLTAPLPTVSDALLASLKTEQVDAFAHGDTHYVVLEAPGEAYLESLFYAARANAVSIAHLPFDWTGEAMSELALDDRMRFSAPMACGFCI
ncbi:hypothetical protein N8I71_19200 [Roseibacterium sp. SDUM158016]|uniref:hypothetical protein n=1 Tax=Roseicyclus sediminis TaxID=2980997 RepID=UPI0021D3673B|nr:hypothetical protein [Roseibacterium sp. SDUM158016]MCU4654972.1 hypothetical protein [Roseibacterium sp. SDUM158016]